MKVPLRVSPRTLNPLPRFWLSLPLAALALTAAVQDPDFVETYNRIYEQGLGDGRHVSAKVREFVAIALLAFRGAEKAGLVAHMKRAIRLGATREEIFEVLETCLVPGGAPTFHRGLTALIELDGERGPS